MKKFIRFYGDKTWYKVEEYKKGYVKIYDPDYEDFYWQREEYIEEQVDNLH